MSVNAREYYRMKAILLSLGWRVEPTQKGSPTSKKTIHSLCYSPDPTIMPMPLGTTNDPRAKRNTYAAFRRIGVELDPRRLPGRK